MSNPNSPSPTSGTVTAFDPSVSTAQVLAANGNRQGAAIYNNHASANLYIRLGTSAATTTAGGFTVKIVAGGYYELPADYRGAVQGIWDSGSGNSASVTELT